MTKAHNSIDVERLKDVLDYSPESGLLFWRKRLSIRINKGDVAGCRGLRGYIILKVDGVGLFAHRAAWAIYYGSWPNGIIDHIDRDRTNNKICNLRISNAADNAHNCSIRKNNTSGVHGVSFDKRSGKWLAKICINRKQIFLGHFERIEDARIARVNAELKIHPAYASAPKRLDNFSESFSSQ